MLDFHATKRHVVRGAYDPLMGCVRGATPLNLYFSDYIYINVCMIRELR